MPASRSETNTDLLSKIQLLLAVKTIVHRCSIMTSLPLPPLLWSLCSSKAKSFGSGLQETAAVGAARVLLALFLDGGRDDDFQSGYRFCCFSPPCLSGGAGQKRTCRGEENGGLCDVVPSHLLSILHSLVWKKKWGKEQKRKCEGAKNDTLECLQHSSAPFFSPLYFLLRRC